MFKILYGMNSYHDASMISNDVMVKGLAVKETGDDTGIVAACASTEPDGFILVEVTTDGPSFLEYEHREGIAVEEVQVGNQVSIRDGDGELVTDVVVESGNRAMSGASFDDDLTIADGLWGVALTGDVVCGRLRGTDYNGESGEYHIRRIPGLGIKV